MFEDSLDFYPTPDSVIYKMMAPYIRELRSTVKLDYTPPKPYVFDRKGIKNILEPSAGKGNIVDYINNNIEIPRKTRIYAVEYDTELQYTLRGKNCRLIDTDFLNYNGDYQFDFIVMNPPFSSGEKHLLKAWDVLKHGDIVCLLNHETIRNPYSRERKLLKDVIEEHGEVEYLGDVFNDAERSARVEVSIVRLFKYDNKSDFDFHFDQAGSEYKHEFNEETARDTLAFNNVTETMLRQYEKTKEAFVDYIRSLEKLKFYSQGLIRKERDITRIASESYSDSESLEEAYNDFLDDFKFHAWKFILDKLNVEKYLTQREFDRFQEFAKEQGSVDLTKENISQLVQLLIHNRNSIMENAVVEVFDIFTKYHKENRVHVEGWKTNDFWKVNKKVILPNYIDLKFGGFDVATWRRREFEDIDKVMAYLTGKDYNDICTLVESIPKYNLGEVHESEFFYFRCFKKGTIHLWFKDEWLWAEFNQRAVQGKNWLGN